MLQCIYPMTRAPSGPVSECRPREGVWVALLAPHSAFITQGRGPFLLNFNARKQEMEKDEENGTS